MALDHQTTLTITFKVDFVSARKEHPDAAVHLWIVTLAMTMIEVFVTVRRTQPDVTVHLIRADRSQCI